MQTCSKIVRLLGSLLILAVATAAPAQAQTIASLPAGAAPALSGEVVRPIAAWLDFCKREPAECRVDPSEPALVALTPALWKTLTAVNRAVNTSVKPMTDLDHWGVADRWDLADDGYGDCEDFQLLKRKRLVQAGLPRRALRMTVVIDEKSEGHAVLMLRTDRGDFILDNKTSDVLAWHDTGYIFVKREGHDGSAWVSLGRATSPAATANP